MQHFASSELSNKLELINRLTSSIDTVGGIASTRPRRLRGARVLSYCGRNIIVEGFDVGRSRTGEKFGNEALHCGSTVAGYRGRCSCQRVAGRCCIIIVEVCIAGNGF
jgi:hypothetical protein